MQYNENLQPIGIEDIKTKIYEIRGQKVMLDRDLAELYHVETKRLNEQVKRNLMRFPSDFMFQLSEMEFKNLKSQIATSRWGGVRKLPNAFTELGIAMLSSVLSSEVAIQVNINIMRVFVVLKNAVNLNEIAIKVENVNLKINSMQEYIENILTTQNDINADTAMQLELINQTLAELQNDKAQREILTNRKPVGFKINEK